MRRRRLTPVRFFFHSGFFTLELGAMREYEEIDTSQGRNVALELSWDTSYARCLASSAILKVKSHARSTISDIPKVSSRVFSNKCWYDLSGSSLTATVSESVLQNSVWFALSLELCALTILHMI